MTQHSKAPPIEYSVEEANHGVVLSFGVDPDVIIKANGQRIELTRQQWIYIAAQARLMAACVDPVEAELQRHIISNLSGGLLRAAEKVRAELARFEARVGDVQRPPEGVQP